MSFKEEEASSSPDLGKINISKPNLLNFSKLSALVLTYLLNFRMNFRISLSFLPKHLLGF